MTLQGPHEVTWYTKVSHIVWQLVYKGASLAVQPPPGKVWISLVLLMVWPYWMYVFANPSFYFLDVHLRQRIPDRIQLGRGQCTIWGRKTAKWKASVLIPFLWSNCPLGHSLCHWCWGPPLCLLNRIISSTAAVLYILYFHGHNFSVCQHWD